MGVETAHVMEDKLQERGDRNVRVKKEELAPVYVISVKKKCFVSESWIHLGALDALQQAVRL